MCTLPLDYVVRITGSVHDNIDWKDAWELINLRQQNKNNLMGPGYSAVIESTINSMEKSMKQDMIVDRKNNSGHEVTGQNKAKNLTPNMNSTCVKTYWIAKVITACGPLLR